MFPGNVVGKHTDTNKTDMGEGFNERTTAATAHLAKASSAAVHTTPLPTCIGEQEKLSRLRISQFHVLL